MTRSGPGLDQDRPLGPVHSPAGPGLTIWVQVCPYLDLDPDFWGPNPGPPGPGPARGQSSLNRFTPDFNWSTQIWNCDGPETGPRSWS